MEGARTFHKVPAAQGVKHVYYDRTRRRQAITVLTEDEGELP
jgi:hypothetical protein